MSDARTFTFNTRNYTVHEVMREFRDAIFSLPPPPSVTLKPHSKFVVDDAQKRLSPRGKKDRRRNWAHYSR